MHTIPTLTVVPSAGDGLPVRTVAYDQVLQAHLHELTVDADSPLSANDAVSVLLDDWALSVGPDTAAALWARVVALDEDAATIGTDAQVSYRTADVARWLLERYHDLVTDPELSRRLGWVAAFDPDPTDGPHSGETIEQAWETHEQEGADRRVGTDLDEVARTWQIPLPGDDHILGMVNLWPRPDYGYDVQLLGDDMVGEIVPTADGWQAVDVDAPTQPTRERAIEVLLTAANLMPAVTPTGAVRRVAVAVPACWVGLLVFGEFEDDGTVAGPLTDLLGRPVTSEKAVAGVDDPAPHYDDSRLVDGRAGGLTAWLQLASGQSNYWVDVAVEHAESDPATGGPLVVESDPAFDLHGPVELHAWDGNGPIVVDLQLTWPTENRRQIAIDTLKRIYGVSKRVAARTVDEARWDLCPDRPAEVADIVGAIAVGHLSAAAVGRLLEDASDGRLAGMWDGPRLLAVIADGQQVAHVDAADWTVMQIGEDTVGTGLPADGGPNPWTAARRIVAAIR